MNNNNWSIEIVAEDLKLGFWDLLDHHLSRNGEDAAHSYLLLKDETGKIVSRIDGLAYDSVNERAKFCSGGLATYFSVISHSLGLSSTFDYAAKALGLHENFARLKVLIQMGDDFGAQDNPEAITLIEKPKGEILHTWLKACEAAEAINDKDFVYVPTNIFRSGQNCHSVTSTLLRAAGCRMNQNPFKGFSTPGLGNVILSSDILDSIQHSAMSPEEQMRRLDDLCVASGNELDLHISELKVLHSSELEPVKETANDNTDQAPAAIIG